MFRRRGFVARFLVVMGTTLAMGGAMVAPTSARSAPAGLSKSDLASAWNSMSAQEKELRKAYFKSNRYIIVGFSSAVQSFDQKTGEPVGAPQRLVLGNAGPTPLPATTGSGGTANLYISIAIAFDSQAPAYRWDITDYFKWNGWPPNGYDGMDQLATAWANNLALNSDYAYGHSNNQGTFAFTRNDMSPNVGTSWEFNECNNCYSWGGMTDWGYLLATIKETSLHNQSTNAVFKYYHTWSSQQYSIGFSASGPSIGISPTSSQASLATYTSFVN
ncbi:MAG: hypothetical protein HY264_04985 [Chloroflexi bacterium]|nr:hypothetical protein [Chloroflexota bacterium]